MKKSNVIRLIKGLKKEILKIKTLQQSVLFHLENQQSNLQANLLPLGDRISAIKTYYLLGCSPVPFWKLGNCGSLPFAKYSVTIRFEKIAVVNSLNKRG